MVLVVPDAASARVRAKGIEEEETVVALEVRAREIEAAAVDQKVAREERVAEVDLNHTRCWLPALPPRVHRQANISWPLPF